MYKKRLMSKLTCKYAMEHIFFLNTITICLYKYLNFLNVHVLRFQMVSTLKTNNKKFFFYL